MEIRVVAIAGVGLIGGSFGLSLRRAGFSGEIIGVSSAPAIEAGLRSGAISASADLETAASRADLIYLSQPVDRILETIRKLGPICSEGTLITDAGSTKSAIVHQASLHITHATFLGGHPMAGKEQRGVEAADARLFQDRPYVLTPTRPALPRELTFRDWLNRLGCKVVEMTPREHDATVALSSHLPQLISTTLANVVAKSDNSHINAVFGTGLLDMTRLALSSYDLWSSILGTNKYEVLSALGLFRRELESLQLSLEKNDLEALFHSAQRFAGTLRNHPIN